MVIDKGNVVAEYNINGVKVKVYDDAYAGVPEEVLERRRKYARQVAWNIALRHEMRRLEELERSQQVDCQEDQSQAQA